MCVICIYMTSSSSENIAWHTSSGYLHNPSVAEANKSDTANNCNNQLVGSSV